ncbi:MAG TPA: hypothetical protein VL382_07430 [Terriglobales bacterium]|nr:hypothetical protein [Terriglobales bacterium]
MAEDVIGEWAAFLEGIAASDEWRADLYHEAEHEQDWLPDGLDRVTRRVLEIMDELARDAKARAWSPESSLAPERRIALKRQLVECAAEMRAFARKSA